MKGNNKNRLSESIKLNIYTRMVLFDEKWAYIVLTKKGIEKRDSYKSKCP